LENGPTFVATVMALLSHICRLLRGNGSLGFGDSTADQRRLWYDGDGLRKFLKADKVIPSSTQGMM